MISKITVFVSSAVLSLAINGCASTLSSSVVSREEAIEIARSHVMLNEKWNYDISANFIGNEWVILFDSNSNAVGDYVFVHLLPDGTLKRVDGGR